MKILVTGGATQEPIDQVRFITNFSTGETSARMARFFAIKGHEVILLSGIGAVSASEPRVREIGFRDFQDLERKLQAELRDGSVDAVVHAAAVSDYSVREVEVAGKIHAAGAHPKIDSRAGEITLRLKRNHKLLDRLKQYSSNASLKVVGFKLTHTRDEEERLQAVRNTARNVDWIVHNDYGDITEGRRTFTLYRTSGARIERDGKCTTREELALALEDKLSQA